MDLPEGFNWGFEEAVDSYGWIAVQLRDIEARFAAAYWISENCGTEYIDYIYGSPDMWAFRNHEAAAVFKLIYG